LIINHPRRKRRGIGDAFEKSLAKPLPAAQFLRPKGRGIKPGLRNKEMQKLLNQIITNLDRQNQQSVLIDELKQRNQKLVETIELMKIDHESQIKKPKRR
jgi:hypothetical protein